MGPPAQDPASSPSGSSRRRRRLDRRNASKNIGYDATLFCSYPPSPSPASSAPASGSPSLSGSAACSLDLTSFRIGASGDGGGDLKLLCQSLGLSGPDDFAIPVADWEAHKAVRSSNSASSSPSAQPHPDPPARGSPLRRYAAEVPALPSAANSELPLKETATDLAIEAPAQPARLDPQEPARPDVKKAGCEGGIKGVRLPPVMLKPPPSMALSAVCLVGSTWDILRSFAPKEKGHAPAGRYVGGFRGHDAEEDEDAAGVLTLEELRLGETSEEFTGTSSLSTTNDHRVLGSGSFGTVYEGISE